MIKIIKIFFILTLWGCGGRSGSQQAANVDLSKFIKIDDNIKIQDLDLKFKDILKKEKDETSGFVYGGVNSDEIIKNLTHLNNVPIEELESRMRPKGRVKLLKGKKPTKEAYEKIFGMWGCCSESGFISKDDNLIDVLLNDNKYVREKGLSHREMALPLLITHCRKIFGNVFDYSRPKFFIYKGKKYKLLKVSTMGLQGSPLEDGLLGSEEFTIANLENGKELIVGGFIPYYIWRYGFYEGNVSYRVDPKQILQVFF